MPDLQTTDISKDLSTKRDSGLPKITTGSVTGDSKGLVREGKGCGFLPPPHTPHLE